MNTKSCKDCGDTTDDLTTNFQCYICFQMEINPEIFTTTEEQWESMNKCADLVKKLGIAPNLDFPE